MFYIMCFYVERDESSCFQRSKALAARRGLDKPCPSTRVFLSCKKRSGLPSIQSTDHGGRRVLAWTALGRLRGGGAGGGLRNPKYIKIACTAVWGFYEHLHYIYRVHESQPKHSLCMIIRTTIVLTVAPLRDSNSTHVMGRSWKWKVGLFSGTNTYNREKVRPPPPQTPGNNNNQNSTSKLPYRVKTTKTVS